MHEMIKTHRNCPVCGNSEGEKLHSFMEILPVEYNLSSCYYLVKCDKCGMCYADI